MSSLLYDSKYWTLTKHQLPQIESSEVRFPVSVSGYRRMDKRRYYTGIKYIQSEREDKRIFSELLGTYFKNVDVSNSSEVV